MVGTAYAFTTYYDEAVGPLLDGLTVDEFDCVVLASNALLSESVLRAFQRRLAAFHAYLESGGGLLVLHHWRDTLAPIVPDHLLPSWRTRESPADARPARATERDDMLLHVPFAVDCAELRDRARPPAPERLFFKAIEPDSLPTALKVVLTKDPSEVLMVRTDDHVDQRVVITPMPLDWQSSLGLLANALHYGCSGAPRRLAWRAPRPEGAELLFRWLALDRGTLFRPAPPADTPVSGVDGWLLSAEQSHLELLVVPPEAQPTITTRPEVDRFLARGGTVLTVVPDSSLPGTKVTALVGSHAERAMAIRLYGELRAEPGWRHVESAFGIRNIVCALAMLWDDEDNRSHGALPVDEVGDQLEEICVRLGTPRHQDDLGSSLALAQTAPFLAPKHDLDQCLVSWMTARHDAQGADIRLQVRAVLALWNDEPDPQLWRDAVELSASWTPDMPSVAPLVRVLDSLAVVAQRWPDDRHPKAAATIADRACQLLDGAPADASMGWISVEATADIVRGLVALWDHTPPSTGGAATREHLADHIGTGVATLRRALPRYERNPDGVAWLARVTHALVVTERCFPVGLQRLATLRWPTTEPAHAAETLLPLIDHLGATNKDLREDRNRLRATRRAAALGRATATCAATALMAVTVVAIALVVLPDRSVWGLVGALSVVGAGLLSALTFCFTLLDRNGLLAGPARRLLSLVERALQTAQKVGEARGR